MEHYLLVDMGTGNTRVALVTSAGEIIGIHTVTNVYYRDEAYADAQYFIPEEWEREILRCCELLHAEHPDIRVSAVSSAGTRQTIVLLDAGGRAYCGLPNVDNRGRDYMHLVTAPHDELYRLSGKWVTEDCCAAKLLGLRMGRPELYSRCAKLVSESEWIAYMFTGVLLTEPTQACETQLYDLESGAWSDKLCEAYGIDTSLLPPLANAGSVAGPVLEKYVRAFGMEPGAVFIVGGADTQVALRQTGLSGGELAVVSGTTSPVVTLTPERFYDPEQRVWSDAGLGGRGHVTEMNPGVTGLNYQRIKSALCPDMEYAELEAAYAVKDRFYCTASFSSLLFYERKPLRHGGFFSRSPLDAGLDRVDMAWAVLADIACSIYEQLRRLRELTGIETDYVRCCGGGFRSAALCGMLAELSGLRLVLRSGFEQATVAGLAGICSESLGTAAAHGGDTREFLPGGSPLVRDYYPVWLENRKQANSY